MAINKLFALRFILITASLMGVLNISSAEIAATTSKADATESAIFAGGCFWCMEPPFDKLDGVISTTSGYTSGQLENPSYKQVSAGNSGHTEAVEIVFDPKKVSYEKLLEVFWMNIDPLNAKGQFCDFGTQYRTGIYFKSSQQQALADASKQKIVARLGQPVATEIVEASKFYPAEDYHQNYYQINPVRYKYYRWNCGRDQRLQELWGDKASH